MSLKSVEVLFSGEPTIVYINQGPAGDSFSAPISTITDTNLTGYIYGNGTKIGGATPGSASATASTMAIRDGSGNLAAGAFLLPNGSNTGTIDNATLTANRTYTMPDASGYVALTTNANGSVTNTEVYVKAGEAISAGNAVYISGASGANKIVSLAQANSDSLSSKTLGLSLQNLTTNQFGYVVSEGKLSGLSINLGAGHTVVEGDPIWLSPTTPGGLLFGLANKPSAPNHLVSLGVVTNINGNTLTDIFVKVQNGFELKELHDVQISSPSNGQVLTYDLSTDLWKNANPQGGSGSITTSTATNLTGFIQGNGANISGGTIGSTINAANSIVIRDSNGLVQCSSLRLRGSGYNSDINPIGTQTANRTYTLPDSTGTVALNTTAVMLTGNQLSIGGNKTFNGQLQATLQFAVDNDSLMTRNLCDQRYDRKFYAMSVNAVSASSTTPVTICNTIPLESGTYRIEAYVASIHSATGGTVIGLVSDQNMAIQFLEQYGRPSAAISATPISNDSTMSSTKSDLGGLEFYRRIEGICFLQANTIISLTIAQSVNDAVATTTRKRSYLTLQKLF